MSACGKIFSEISKELFVMKELFGKTQCGKDAMLYTLKSEECEVKITDYGATVVSFAAFGKDIVGGFDTLEEYMTDDSHQGATIGRVANRIAGAAFKMDGKEYKLTANNNGNCLHGGVGFDFKLWQVKEYDGSKIVLGYTSEDGEEGFPSRLNVQVTYTLDGSDLIIDYLAIPEGKTPISLTNHAYFNLDGFGGDILEHEMTIYAEHYTKVGEDLIPTGERPAVALTPFDFTAPHKIGERIEDTDGGYDHNFILCPKIYRKFANKSLALAAEASGKELCLRVYTDQVGIQFYTGNFLGNGHSFKGGIKQIKHGAFCLEAQTEPNSVNHGIGFYDKGEAYTQTTVYSLEKM